LVAGEVDVNSLGALVHSIALKLPPGRNGAAPSLALAYSSGSAEQASAFGAGWSLSLSAIRRSTRFGTPMIARQGNTYRYDDDFSDASDLLPLFERDGTDLVVDRLNQSIRRLANHLGTSRKRRRVHRPMCHYPRRASSGRRMICTALNLTRICRF
jgi:hypothetical protein